MVTFDYRGWGKSDSRLVPADKKIERKDGKLIAEVKEVREVVDPIDQTTDILNAIHWVIGEKQCDPRPHWPLGVVVFGRPRRLRRGPRSACQGVRQPGGCDGLAVGHRQSGNAAVHLQPGDGTRSRADRLSQAARKVRHARPEHP